AGGAPIIGDVNYGGPSGADYRGPYLHAWKLRSPHPRRKARMSFTAPLPAQGLRAHVEQNSQLGAMSERGWIERLKTRWKLKSTGQVIVVLIVFACTGLTIVYLKGPVLRALAGEPPFSATATILYYVFILPVYNIILLAYGFIFGQF